MEDTRREPRRKASTTSNLQTLPEETEAEAGMTNNEQEPLMNGDRQRRLSNALEFDDNEDDDDDDAEGDSPSETESRSSERVTHPPLTIWSRRGTKRQPRRRLSTYESADALMDLEADDVGGSARSL